MNQRDKEGAKKELAHRTYTLVETLFSEGWHLQSTFFSISFSLPCLHLSQEPADLGPLVVTSAVSLQPSDTPSPLAS
jgi:hypothetical protein